MTLKLTGHLDVCCSSEGCFETWKVGAELFTPCASIEAPEDRRHQIICWEYVDECPSCGNVHEYQATFEFVDAIMTYSDVTGTTEFANHLTLIGVAHAGA